MGIGIGSVVGSLVILVLWADGRLYGLELRRDLFRPETRVEIVGGWGKVWRDAQVFPCF